MLVLPCGRIWPIVQQLSTVLGGCGRRRWGYSATIVGIEGTQGRVFERQLARIQVGAEELVGRLVDRAVRKLGGVGSVWEIVCGGVGGEGTTTGGVMGRLLVYLLLHGALFNVVGEFSWRHSVTKENKMNLQEMSFQSVIEPC